MNTAIKRMGFDATAHGMRTLFSSTTNEFGFNPDAIEKQLSHVDKNQVRSAYNRAQYESERKMMVQAWADFLDQLKRDPDIKKAEQLLRTNVINFYNLS